MKRFNILFLFLLVGTGILGVKASTINDTPKILATIYKFEFANYEILNLDKTSYSEILFKENNCESRGYSFFSPFHLKEELLSSKINSELVDNSVRMTVSFNSEVHHLFISDIVISKDNSYAEFNLKKEEVIYLSKVHGSNLSVEILLDAFSNLEDDNVLQAEICPPCLLAATVIAVDAVVVNKCKSSQQANSPCNGVMKVAACSCSCE